MGASAVYVTTPQLKESNITQGNTQAIIYTAGASGSKIVGVYATTTDTVQNNVQIGIGNNTVIWAVLTTWAVPIGSGTANCTTPTVSLFASSQMPSLPIDNDGQEYLFLPNTGATQMWAQTVANVTAAKQLSIFTCAGDF